jgi:hypothetical protein
MFVCCVLCVLCCQVEVSATSLSPVMRSPTDCGASLCVIEKPCERGGHSRLWAAELEKIYNNTDILGFLSDFEEIKNKRTLENTKCTKLHMEHQTTLTP